MRGKWEGIHTEYLKYPWSFGPKELTFPDGCERSAFLWVKTNLLQCHYTAHHTAGYHGNGKEVHQLQ